jgi:hypothetical protein
MKTSDPLIASFTPVPFHIEIRRLYDHDDGITNEVGFGVVGVDQPTVVNIVNDEDSDPRIVARLSRGNLELPDSLLDLLAINCFWLLHGMIVEQDGQSGWWTLSDATQWIRKTLPVVDADQILNELSRHVKSVTKVQSTCLVADDDAI